MTSILWAKLSWRHMGAHSGIAPLMRVIEQRRPGSIRTVSGAPDIAQMAQVLWQRARRACGIRVENTGWAHIRESGVPFYSHSSWNVERRIMRCVEEAAPDWVVLPGVEDQLFLLASERKKWHRTRLVGISHQPPSWWELSHAHPDVINGLDLLVVLSSAAKRFWDLRVDPAKVSFIPHGVDTGFFRPATTMTKSAGGGDRLRVVSGGRYLRDFETLSLVVRAAEQQLLPIHFDLIIPRPRRSLDACGSLIGSRNVSWHTNVSDEQMRKIYQQADLLLLPLKDGTANNSLLEGMACGLPVVVTDVGGVRDYTTGEFADYVWSGSADESIELLKAYADRRQALATRGTAARAHAEAHFSWDVIANRFLADLDQR